LGRPTPGRDPSQCAGGRLKGLCGCDAPIHISTVRSSNKKNTTPPRRTPRVEGGPSAPPTGPLSPHRCRPSGGWGAGSRPPWAASSRPSRTAAGGPVSAASGPSSPSPHGPAAFASLLPHPPFVDVVSLSKKAAVLPPLSLPPRSQPGRGEKNGPAIRPPSGARLLLKEKGMGWGGGSASSL